MSEKKLVKINCPICDHRDTKKIIYKKKLPLAFSETNYEGRKNPDSFHYEMVRCLTCGLLFASEIYQNETIVDLYKDSKFNYSDELKGLRKTYGSCILNSIDNSTIKENFLDIGCGNGFLLEEAKKIGFKNVFGSEISLDAIAKSLPEITKHIIQGPFDAKNFKTSSFDVIFFAMVIEHFDNPNLFLKDVYKLLKPNGILIGVTHDERHILSLLLRNKHPIINDEHIAIFDKKTLKKLFIKHNFEVLDVKSLTNYYTVGYWVKMFPFPSFLKKIINKVINLFKIKHNNIGIKAGNIFIISKKTN
jgi:2-polyprenyl-3-methyl-5-hydroxy-6-metoxy-1,4-benzoquinol methylase